MGLDGIEQRLLHLEDIEAIKRLKARYCAYLDDGYNADDVASLFVENGVWDDERWGRYEGRAAIRDFFRRVSGSFTFAVHYVVNPIIGVDGDTAHGTWYLFMAGTLTEGNQAIWNAAEYSEDYVRVDGEWRFQLLRITGYHFTTPFEVGWAKQRFL